MSPRNRILIIELVNVFSSSLFKHSSKTMTIKKNTEVVESLLMFLCETTGIPEIRRIQFPDMMIIHNAYNRHLHHTLHCRASPLV